MFSDNNVSVLKPYMTLGSSVDEDFVGYRGAIFATVFEWNYGKNDSFLTLKNFLNFKNLIHNFLDKLKSNIFSVYKFEESHYHCKICSDNWNHFFCICYVGISSIVQSFSDVQSIRKVHHAEIHTCLIYVFVWQDEVVTEWIGQNQ